MSFFHLENNDSQARAGLITLHNNRTIRTPVFMPVGTRGTVKAISQQELRELDIEIILCNTYHLYLRPGHQLIEQTSSGLHKFISWDRGILTDSGGYQVYSLAPLRKISEEGVFFKSHIDGSAHLLTPEKSIEIQRSLNSDIVMCFDECPGLPAPYEILDKSVELTARWAKRCLSVPLNKGQNIFAIIQGGLNLDLRMKSLELLKDSDNDNAFAGYALGGLSVGEKNEEMVELCEKFVPHMPKNKPRYLMGVGTPLDILRGISNGIDMFDCVLPCRNARNGQAFTTRGPLNIKNSRFTMDTGPLDPDCECKVCKNYSRTYLRHLYLVGEYLAGQLLTYHNLHFYTQMVRQAREAILQNKFKEYFERFLVNYSSARWTS
ncbi:MAG: tRNA guanosine(34) transglycosylase Tgt [Oligoflexia bacterium]|nr:tRNA guanosine(34) transglycosylase Tgt [Oligoflexia bacterium]